MKPRIWVIDGLYVCKLRGTITGYGYDPEAAYKEWRRMNAHL